MNRRSFILLSGLGISGLTVSTVNLFDLDYNDFLHHHAKPKFLSQLCNDNTIHDLGQAYLDLKPAEADKELLMKVLYGGPVNIEALEQSDLLLMHAQTKNSIKEGFASGETIILKGWVLSLTEARQCALFTILNS